MSNATRGTVLAGRYRLEDRYHANTDASVWRAADLTLERPVTVRVMRPGHPHSPDVADAARRAALIDDPRLVRVLDVGTDGDLTFVVSSHVDGDSLATLIERAPLSPPVVRRIVGEVALGLRGAAARGLHHLRLTPRSVIVCYDHTVKISGVAVEAAGAGLEPTGATQATQATRVDALALIGLLYAGLTGRWPLGDEGFPPAPRANDGGPIAPAELVPDIPGDLNRLCLLTLGPLDRGPHTPAEVVGLLSPWPTPDEAPLRSATRPRDPATPATPNPALVMRGRSHREHTPSAGFRPGGPVTSGPTASPSSSAGSPSEHSAPKRQVSPMTPAASAEDDPDRTVSAWPPAGGELFDPRRRNQGQGSSDPDVTLPPGTGAGFAPLRRDAGPPRRAEAAVPAERPDPALNRRPSAWPTGASTHRSMPAEDVTRPSQTRPDVQARSAPPMRPAPPPAPAPGRERAPRRTASLFPTPSVAITGSMPLPPRVKSSKRTDALFGGEPEPEQSAPASPAGPQAQPQGRPEQSQSPQRGYPSRSSSAHPLQPAPSPQRFQGQGRGEAGLPSSRQQDQRAAPPLMASPLRPQRPTNNPAAGARPMQPSPQPGQAQPHQAHANQLAQPIQSSADRAAPNRPGANWPQPNEPQQSRLQPNQPRPHQPQPDRPESSQSQQGQFQPRQPHPGPAQGRPGLENRPEQRNQSEAGERPGADGRPARRTASLFPTPSVAMTGSMPLPPRGMNRRRTEALFGDISPAVDTQAIPVPLQALEQAKKGAQQRPSAQPGRSPSSGPQHSNASAQPAQFAQPPRTRPAANPLDSGPIATAAAARTAAGMRAGRPTSRPIGDPAPQMESHPQAESFGEGQGYGQDQGQGYSQGQGFGQGSPGPAGNQGFGPALGYGPAHPEPQSQWALQGQNPAARPRVPGSPPSLFASPNPSAGDAPGGELASPHEAGQHAGMGSERAAGPGRHRGPAEGRAPAAANSRLPWEEGWSPNPHSVGPPSALESSGPFAIVIPPDAPPKNQSRKVLAGVLIVFVVLLLVAAWSLRGLFTGSDDSAAGRREQGPVLTTAPIASQSQDEPAQTSAPAAPSPTEEPVAVEIKTASAIDPLGDGDEDSAGAPQAVDGDEDTTWESERYQSAAFGGLKKGLGLAIELRRTAAVSSAEIDVAGTGGRVQLRAADEPEFEGSTSLGSGSFENGTVTVDAKGDADASKYVILWFTELPAVESGYRMEVSEVRLT